jgi:hypothetical protein
MSTPAIILEQFAGHVGRGPVAGRGHVDLAGIGFGIGDKFGDRMDRNRWMDVGNVGRTRTVPATGAMSRMKL